MLYRGGEAKMKKILLAMSLVALSGTTMAAGNADAGKGKTAMCAACHGANGVGIGPTFPNIAGQKAEYTVLQLKAFKDGSRKGGNAAQMVGMVAALSDQDMADIAAYYESLDAAK